MANIQSQKCVNFEINAYLRNQFALHPEDIIMKVVQGRLYASFNKENHLIGSFTFAPKITSWRVRNQSIDIYFIL